jgi:hypothetical protein
MLLLVLAGDGGAQAVRKPATSKAAAKPTAAKPTAAKPAATRSTAAARPAAGKGVAAAKLATPAPVPAPAAAAASGAAGPAGEAQRAARSITVHEGPGGRALATLAPNTVVTPLVRDGGWVRVRLEAWVPERDLLPADTAVRTQLAAADLRADPEGTRGRTVRWEVELLAFQVADVLRRELAEEEPYLLVRGPGEENALLYLALPPSLVAQGRGLPPLTRVLVTARVRNGRSAPAGVPVLDLLTFTPLRGS